MKKAMILGAAFFLAWLCGPAQIASALGMEAIGNQPLAGVNYDRWEKIKPVVNDPGRVYHWWVNGNENFYYRGDTDALNAFLKNFAQIRPSPLKLIIVDDAPASTKTFHGEPIQYDWEMHLLGGIAAGIQSRDKKIHLDPSQLPIVVTVHHGANKIDRNRISLPKGVKVEEPAAAPAATIDLTAAMTEVLKEIQTVKPGMTRADLLKVFKEEGGLSNRVRRTYVHKKCLLIKVDVEFRLVGNEKDMLAENGKDVITKISQPYLAWGIQD